METKVDEIAERIYRLSTFMPKVGPRGFTFNQFLVDAAEPLLFATAGARVALVDVRGPELTRTVADVRAAGGAAEATAVDLARPEDCAAAVAAVVAAFGRLDVLLNNAGVGTRDE